MNTMPSDIQILAIVELFCGHRVVKDKAGTTDQMPSLGIIYTAIIEEVLKKSSSFPVNAAWMIKRHDGADMVQQKFLVTEFWIHHNSLLQREINLNNQASARTIL